MSLLRLLMAITSKPYQSVPLLAVGMVNCGCDTTSCLHFLDDDIIAFQVGLSACGDELVCRGDFTPLYTGHNSSLGSTLIDLGANFNPDAECGGVQAGATCGFVVKNVTLGTYSYVTVVVSATELTLNAVLFTAIGQAYAIFPWHADADAWTFDGASATSTPVVTALRQCTLGLVDNRYYVLSYDVLTSNADQMVAVLGGDGELGAEGGTVGSHSVGFSPQVWANDNLEFDLGLGGIIQSLDKASVKQYSTVGIRIKDCDGNVLLDDSTNSHGWITYGSGFLGTEEDARAHVRIPWNTTGLGLGCFQICLYDLCSDYAPGFEPCILESYTLSIIDDTEEPSCGLKIEWTNNEDFEIEDGDYLEYPQYPSTTYTQLLRTDGSLRFAGYANDDHTVDTQSDGLREVVHSSLHKTYELQLAPLLEPLHEAIAAGLRHDVFSVNDELYVWADGEYQPKWVKTADIASVVVKLIPQYSKGENVA